jgi:hypothetical protein
VDPIVIPVDLDAYVSGDPQTLIDEATTQVRSYCGWHVTPSVTETVTLDASGMATQMLPSLHVTDVATVTYDGAVLAADDYEWREIGVLHLKYDGPNISQLCKWSLKNRSVEVTMTHGYASAPDVAGVILALASRAQSAPGGGFVRQVGQVSFQAPSGDGGGYLLESEKAVLDRYKLPPRP